MQKPHRDVRYRGDERTWLGCHLRSVDDPTTDIRQFFPKRAPLLNFICSAGGTRDSGRIREDSHRDRRSVNRKHQELRLLNCCLATSLKLWQEFTARPVLVERLELGRKGTRWG